MEQLLLKASTTATDEGIFEAVISTASVDREKDIVDPAGMVRALHKWPEGKNIPLAWNHSSKPEDQIGYLQPSTARVVGNEVVATGWIDQSTEVGAHAWRQAKAGTLGFSFGYMIPDGGSSKRKGGGRTITELDVFEVTATPTPMNNDTRVLSTKAAAKQSTGQMAPGLDAPDDDTDVEPSDDQSMTPTQLRILNSMIGQAQEFIGTDPDDEDADEMRQIIDTLQDLVSEPDGDDDNGKSLRRRADSAVVDFATNGIAASKQTREPDPKPDLPAGADWLFPDYELDAARAGEFKAVWTTAYVSSLPDSAFLYVEPGGTKDSDGKTVPRSNRHFPVRDANGTVDQAHVRNALSRIPQSNLSQAIKDTAAAKAQRLLDSSKSAEAAAKEPRVVRAADPLKKKADALVLEFASSGESLRKPPQEKVAPEPPPTRTPDELRNLSRELTVLALTGEKLPHE